MGIGFGENEGQGFGGDVGDSNGPGDSGQGTGGWGTGTGEKSNNAAGYANKGDMAGAWGKGQAESPDNMGPFDVALSPPTPDEDKTKEEPGAWDRFTNSFKDVVGKYNSIPKGVTLTAGALVPGSGIAVAAAATLAGVMSALGATPASPEQVAANEKADTDRATNGPGGEMPGILNTNTALVDTPTVATPTVDTPTVNPAQFNARAITSYKGKSYV